MQRQRSIPNGNTKISRHRSRYTDYAELGHFTVLFYRGRQGGCTKMYNARAQLLFCSLNLMFSDVPVAVAVAVFLNFLT